MRRTNGRAARSTPTRGTAPTESSPRRITAADWSSRSCAWSIPTPPTSAVHASRGKATRAEPVAALYEQGRVHHVGRFSALEDQMCEFTPDKPRARGQSPDRVDALVWAITDLMIAQNGTGILDYYRGLVRERSQ